MASRKKAASKKVPPPPGTRKSYGQKAAYFEKYSIDDLEAAGHVGEPSDEEAALLEDLSEKARASVAARKRSKQLNLTVPEDALETLNRIAERQHIPATTLARSWVLQRLERESQKQSFGHDVQKALLDLIRALKSSGFEKLSSKEKPAKFYECWNKAAGPDWIEALSAEQELKDVW